MPGLNIGGQSEASQREDVNRPAESTPTPKPTLGELHTKFSGLSTRPPASEPASAGGTSLAQKQAALKTASSFRKDPTSVSLSDAKATAATANNFRERHGGQVASSFQTANALNQKYNVAGQSSHDTNDIPVKEGVRPSSSANDSSHSLPFIIKKKPPPPPPPKRGMGSDTDSTGPPPPVPLSSRTSSISSCYWTLVLDIPRHSHVRVSMNDESLNQLPTCPYCTFIDRSVTGSICISLVSIAVSSIDGHTAMTTERLHWGSPHTVL